jgi:putative endonuclease
MGLPGWRNQPTGRQVGRTTEIKIMFVVYAIKSLKCKYIYVALSGNLDRSLAEHNGGKNKTTKPYRPFRLIYSEEFDTRLKARIREKYLKSGSGKEFLKNIEAI